MYWETYLAVPIWFMAIFGFITLLHRIVFGSFWPRRHFKGKYSIIISAQNQEETIEGIVRGFILKTGLTKSGDSLLNIVLVDTNSSDHTPEIMKRLAADYTYIKFLNSYELNELLNSQKPTGSE